MENSYSVVDVWNVKDRNGQQHLEAIIQDEKAEQIHVVTRSCDLDVWKNNLLENQTYMVYNGETMLYDMPTKVCDKKYKLFFNRSTTISAVEISDIPQHNFYFKSFTDFQNGDFIGGRLYGAVQQVVRTQVFGAGKKACACLTITNKDESPKGKVVLFLEDNNVVNTQTNVTHSKTTTYATQNWSPEASISITPSKWLSPDSVQDLEGPDLLSPKLSATNAAKTKSGRNTKIK
ncbi:hypothetical protein RYX36_012321 [Vicia faba]